MSNHQSEKSNGLIKKKERKLNVVYFIDSSKTRSFSISLTRLNIFLSLIAVLGVWSLSAFGIIYWFSNNYTDQKKQLEFSQSTIFDYQSRYDGVYELAYPNHLYPSGNTIKRVAAINPVADAEISKLVNKKRGTTGAIKPSVKKNKKVTKKIDKIKTVVNKTAELPSKPKIKKESSKKKSFNLKIEALKVVNKGASVDISFAIRNSNKNTRERGYVWSVAEVERDDGEILFFPSPAHIRLTGKGKVVDGKISHKYNLKNYKKKKFEFRLPKGISGTIKKVKVGLLSRKNELKEFVFLVDVKIKRLEKQKLRPKSKSATQGNVEAEILKEIEKKEDRSALETPPKPASQTEGGETSL